MSDVIGKRELRTRLTPLIEDALAIARAEQVEDAWRALERAHILSQPFAGLHVRVHFHMLKRAIRDRRWREALGQLPRLVFAGPGSLVGRYPRGNRGTTVISMFKPEPMTPEVEALMSPHRQGEPEP